MIVCGKLLLVRCRFLLSRHFIWNYPRLLFDLLPNYHLNSGPRLRFRQDLFLGYFHYHFIKEIIHFIIDLNLPILPIEQAERDLCDRKHHIYHYHQRSLSLRPLNVTVAGSGQRPLLHPYFERVMIFSFDFRNLTIQDLLNQKHQICLPNRFR